MEEGKGREEKKKKKKKKKKKTNKDFEDMVWERKGGPRQNAVLEWTKIHKNTKQPTKPPKIKSKG